MSNSVTTEAIVLRRTNFREADRILQLITPENGKLGVMARGVRKEKSKLAGGIELFAVCEIVAHVGKGELATLTSARLQEFFSHILKDYDRMQFAYEVLKRISKYSSFAQDSRYYEITKTALASLNRLSVDLRIVQAWFFINLSDVIGHELNTSRDDHNEPLKENETYRFDIAEMSFVRDEKGSFGSDHLKLLKLLKIKTPDVISQISGTEDILDDCLGVALALSD